MLTDYIDSALHPRETRDAAGSSTREPSTLLATPRAGNRQRRHPPSEGRAPRHLAQRFPSARAPPAHGHTLALASACLQPHRSPCPGVPADPALTAPHAARPPPVGTALAPRRVAKWRALAAPR